MRAIPTRTIPTPQGPASRFAKTTAQMMVPLNPRDHYWAIGGSTTEVYSSARNIMVPVTDENYVAFTAIRATSQIASVDELAGVLKPYNVLPAWLFNAPSFIQPTPITYSKDQLAAYTADARDRRLKDNIIVNGLPFATDPYTYSSLNSAYIYTQAKTASEFSWRLPDGSFVTLNKVDIAALHDGSNTFGQACYVCEDTTLTAIEAGTITDLAAIDAAFAAVNNVFTGLSRDAQEVRHKRK